LQRTFSTGVQGSNLLTVKDVATILAISPKTICRYLGRGLPTSESPAAFGFGARDIAE